MGADYVCACTVLFPNQGGTVQLTPIVHLNQINYCRSNRSRYASSFDMSHQKPKVMVMHTTVA